MGLIRSLLTSLTKSIKTFNQKEDLTYEEFRYIEQKRSRASRRTELAAAMLETPRLPLGDISRQRAL